MDPCEGVIGMNLDNRTFISNLVRQGRVKDAVFSMYMTPKSIGDAELTLGGINPSRYTGDINYVPAIRIGEHSPGWFIAFDETYVNGERARIGGVAVADSGTSNINAPRIDGEGIYKLISPRIQLLDTKGTWGLPCSEVSDLPMNITFVIGGRGYTIPRQELSVGELVSQPGMCQTLINTPPDVDVWIFGGSLLKYYYTVWDVTQGKERLGFAKVAHSP